MNVFRAPSAHAPSLAPARVATCWWYTLAHEETAPAGLCVTPAALEDFAEALTSFGQMAAAARISQIAREVAREQIGDEGERYVWGFRRLGDALAALRANHRSDYHAYPQPRNLYESSLDRLYQRFPLTDYPRTTALLFSGSLVCEDPRLWADPQMNTRAAIVPDVIAPEDWGRYTLCGFRQGIALVRVSASARWLRIGARSLEDVWANARRDAEAPAIQRGVSALQTAESLAREALLRATPEDAFIHLDDAPRTAARPHPLSPVTRRRQSTSARQRAV